VTLAPALSVRDARIAFGDRVVAEGLTLDFPAGRTTCLLGRSGVGKTSLLRHLAGLMQESGRPDRIAYMAQRDLLLPWLSVLDNVLLGYRLRGDSAALVQARPHAEALLERVGLADRLNDRPEVLSGGMRQRVALARTLCEDRPVVLLDEPFAQLDAVTRLELQDLAAGLLAGRTAVLVTHDPLEALRLGHELRVLAGPPLSAGEPIAPPGDPPRDPAQTSLLALQAHLLARLRAA
jgi:putative hydroxymethylpyrimidine transport system ATP-binding protein